MYFFLLSPEVFQAHHSCFWFSQKAFFEPLHYIVRVLHVNWFNFLGVPAVLVTTKVEQVFICILIELNRAAYDVEMGTSILFACAEAHCVMVLCCLGHARLYGEG